MNVDGYDWNAALEGLLRRDINEPVCVVSLEQEDYKILHVNEHWISTTGFFLQDVLGQPWSQMCGQLANSGDVQSINTAIAAGQSTAGRVVSYKKDGSTFLNGITVIPIGAIHLGSTQVRVACLMMRELSPQAMDADLEQLHEQQLCAGIAVRGCLHQMSEHAASNHRAASVPPGQPQPQPQPHSAAPPTQQQPANAPPPLDIPNETLLLALQQDDYPNLRNFLLAWGEHAVARFRKLPQLSCRLNQTGIEPSAVAQGGFCSGHAAAEGGGGRASRKQPQSSMLCKATALQYALCHQAFRCGALLLIVDPACASPAFQCALVQDMPKRELAIDTPELCALYSRSLASSNPELSNRFAMAGGIIRHWPLIAPQLGLDGQGGGVAELAVEDGGRCVGVLQEAVYAHLGGMAERFVAAREGMGGVAAAEETEMER